MKNMKSPKINFCFHYKERAKQRQINSVLNTEQIKICARFVPENTKFYIIYDNCLHTCKKINKCHIEAITVYQLQKCHLKSLQKRTNWIFHLK